MKIFTSVLAAGVALFLVPQCGQAQQATNTLQQPDCIRPVLLTSTTAPSNFDNRQIGCDTWAFAYSASNMSALSVSVESATTSTTGVPNAYTAFAGTTESGSNPATATTNAEWTGSGYVAWIRVKASVFTPISGAGEIRGTLYGWKMRGAPNGGSGGGGSGGLTPGNDPLLTRYQFNHVVTIGGTGFEKVTVQSCPTCDAAYFESADIYCSAAFFTQFSQNGSAATATAALVTGVNGASTTNAPLAFSASDTTGGTFLRGFYGFAGQTIPLSLTQFYFQAAAGTATNLSITATTTVGATCRIQVEWRKELQ